MITSDLYDYVVICVYVFMLHKTRIMDDDIRIISLLD